MLKKIPVLFFASIFIMICGVFVSCGNSNNEANTVKEDVKDAGENIKNAAEQTGDAVKDTVEDIKFTAIRFKNDFVNSGYEIKENEEGKFDKFSGTETDYYLGDGIVRIYEYNSKEELDREIAKIAPDGLTINGVKEYSVKPHYYSKDNALIIYEGNDTTYINELNNKYGSPII